MPEHTQPRPFSVQGDPIAGESAHIRAENISAIRGDRTLFANINLTISARSRVAIVGENGRGKTTLLGILAGTDVPDAGMVARHGRIALVDQALDFEPNATVGDLISEAVGEARAALDSLERATLAMERGDQDANEQYAQALERAIALDAWDADRRIDIALAGLSACTDRNRPLATLSVGQRYRVRLAVLLGSTTDILLIDEPTNHLDAASLEFLTQALTSRDGAVVVISHDRRLLNDVAQDFLDMDPSADGKPHIYSGGYSGWVEGKRKDRESWEQEYEKQREEQQRLENAVEEARGRLSTGWRPPKGTGKHTRASRGGGVVQAFNRRMEELEKFKLEVPEPPRVLDFPFPKTKPNKTVLEASNVTVTDRLSSQISRRIATGDKVLLVGSNGAGKSTLLDILGGRLAPTTGRVIFSPDAHISYLSQEVPEWETDQPASLVYQRHVEDSGVVLRNGHAPSLTSLGLLDRKSLQTQVGRLSQGQQRRLQLAMCLAELPDLLILDEPTNHLSMSLVNELTQALRETSGAVIVATHDRQMLAELHDWEVIQLP